MAFSPPKNTPAQHKLHTKKLTKTGFDFGFLLTLIVLLTLGLIMVFSSSYPYAYYYFEDGLYFIKKQLMWAAIGTVAMICTAKYDYHNYKKYAGRILAVSLLLLAAVLVIGVEVKGAKRWLGFGGLTFQPSEVAKLGLIIFFAAGLSQLGNKIKEGKFFMRYIAIMLAFMGLLLLEPHFSICIIIGLTLVTMMLVAGARIRHFALLAAPVIFGGIMLVIKEPYRLKRLTAFMDPFADALGSGWQIIQSLYAIGSGGLFGVGFGNSRQKFLYVSEPQNDFIFAIICEELGLIGAIAILCLFAVLLWRGMKIAISAPDSFGCLLVTGIMALIGIQIVLNIAVVTSSIPTTGIPLPFFSAGGSSLVFLMAAMGIVLNVSRYNKQTL
ncbi:MAG: putative lipid II flippase FtsW [Ruminococcaceae bacterium]|nr:putative lipid II flippase FtsW [Oscillospiraceae bacterium]